MMTARLDWKQRWNAALREQHQEFFDSQTRSLKPEYAEYINCPVCDSSDARLLFEKDGFRHVRCQTCSMVYMNPRLNLAATHAFYNSRANAIYNEMKFDGAAGSTELDDRFNFANLETIDKIRHGQKGTLLEVGSAKGYFLSEAQELGYRVYGLELNRSNYERARAQLGDTILNVDLADANFPDGMFDVIYMRDVIEHIPAPASFLQELARVARPGGIVFIETHNVDGWIYKIVRERHTVFFGFEHPNHWSPRTLEKALAPHGLAVRQVIYASPDFTIANILNYVSAPSFTTIYPKPLSRVVRMLIAPWKFLFRLKFVRWLDRKTLPPLANFFRGGSVMKIIAQKAP